MVHDDTPETPQETFDRVYSLINDQLADDLLTAVLEQSPAFFEQLVVDLMKAMDYGDGFVTKYSGDDGIDGIIHEDKLGFNLIYIQAKRWKTDITIGKPELQKFAGAMMGPPKVEKGLFITTAKFSPKAKEYATAQHIVGGLIALVAAHDRSCAQLIDDYRRELEHPVNGLAVSRTADGDAACDNGVLGGDYFSDND